MIMQRAHISSERGTTLIEAMIAAAVMTVGVLGLVPLFYRSVEGIAVASKITQATSLAESKLDELARLPYAASQLDVGAHTEGVSNILSTGLTLSPGVTTASAYGATDGTFARSWAVTGMDYSSTYPGDDYKLITVTVSWYDNGAKRMRSVSLTGGKAILE